MKKFIQDILVSTSGLISSLITALILVFVELQFNFAIYSFTFWFIIPVGAFFQASQQQVDIISVRNYLIINQGVSSY